VGVTASIDKIDFSKDHDRMHMLVNRSRTRLEKSIAAKEGLTYYQEKAGFTGTIF